MSTKVDELGVNLSKIVESYASDVKDDVVATLDKTADAILEYISQHCPRTDTGTEHLADSFAKTEFGSGVNKTIYISSKTKGRLVHLIELGFKHRSGVHVAARPFMRPAYDNFTPEMLEDIREIIANGGKAT